jgi:hypothetical protein
VTWQQTFDQAVAHYATMAMTPGWWQYAQARVAEMEREDVWRGLRDAIGRRVMESGYRPRKSDLAPF